MYLFLLLIFLIIFFIVLFTQSSVENFEMITVKPPNWFIIQEYNPSDWIVKQYVDSTEASCLPYSRASKYGSLENLNYLASATRFWRF